MSLSPQDIIKESIRRYQREKLFAYYDQLEKKEVFEETFHAHLTILTQSLKYIISKQQMNYWLDRVDTLKSTLMQKKELHVVKKHVETLLEDDFLALFDTPSLDTLSSIVDIIDSLEIPFPHTPYTLPQSIQDYLGEFNNTEEDGKGLISFL